MEYIGSKFEEFAKSVFGRLAGISILDPMNQKGWDFLIEVEKNQQTLPVEVKLYKSLIVSRGVIGNAVSQLIRVIEEREFSNAILFTNARIDRIQQDQLVELGVIVFDYDVIENIAKHTPELAGEWGEINDRAAIYRRDERLVLPDPSTKNQKAIARIIGSPPSPPSRKGVTQPIGRGAALCNDIRQAPPRKARQYEQACEAALKYLFSSDLVNWKVQSRSQNAVNIFDITAKVSYNNDFWNALVDDHRGRYIIFERKNYKN